MQLETLKSQQRAIAQRAVFTGSLERVRRFAALDMSHLARSQEPLFAAAVVFETGNPEPLEVKTAHLKESFQYIPGFLSFREMPVLLAAFEQLEHSVDLLFVDGFGRLHPRRAGIATHLGVSLNLPALGVGKTPFVGRVEPLAETSGSTAAIKLEGETLGYALRTRQRSKPVYVSSGHLCSLEAALEFVNAHLDGRRLPYPSRAAHEAANAARLEWEKAQPSQGSLAMMPVS